MSMKRIRYLSLALMLLCGITAKAQEVFNPTNPSEPGPMTTKLIVLADPEDGGSVSGGGSFVPGETKYVSASPSSGWKFVNWTDAAGNEISTTQSFNYVKKDGRETLIAHFVFNPNSPNEPDELPFLLKVVAGEGGSASGGGFYKSGETTNIYASTNSGYDFAGWFLEDGSLYSEESSTTFTMSNQNVVLTAKFKFNPNSPAEPQDNINAKHRLTVVAEEGGTARANEKILEEGTTTTVYASANSSYVFAGWYIGDELVSESSNYEFTMGKSNTTLVAHFNFMPNSPSEPGEIKQRTFSFTLNNKYTKPDATVEYPILLTPRETLKDMTIRINFSTQLNVDFANIVVGETTEPYDMTYEDLGEEGGQHAYQFNLTGGKVDGGNVVIPILTFPIIIPPDSETGVSHQIKINQIIMTNEDGSTQTAGTRNGRVSVYKLGDSNGDNKVDIKDKINVISKLLGDTPEVFIEEVGDVNGDKEITVSDATGVDDYMEPSGESGE